VSFDTVVGWFSDSKAKLVKESESLTDVAMYRNQGARQLLAEFERAFENATRPRR
jgi:hypothetical protein